MFQSQQEYISEKILITGGADLLGQQFRRVLLIKIYLNLQLLID